MSSLATLHNGHVDAKSLKRLAKVRFFLSINKNNEFFIKNKSKDRRVPGSELQTFQFLQLFFRRPTGRPDSGT